MNFIYETLRLGLANLALHKLRSLLTALGIIIGVGAVVAISAYGEGSKRAALEGIRELGANNILLLSVRPPDSEIVVPPSNGGGGGGGMGGSDEPQLIINPFGLTRLDQLRLEQPSIGAVKHMVPLKEVGSSVYRGSQAIKAAHVYGTTPEIGLALPMTIARGRHLTDSDNQQVAAVAVIGADAASHLFRLEDPLDSTFSVDGQRFRVIGVLEPIGVTSGHDVNFDIYIPMSTAEARFGDVRVKPGSQIADQVELSELILHVERTDAVLDVAANVRRVIEVGHEGSQDVQVTVPLELIEQEERTQLMFTVLMIVIASLSLIVGGIGIMNIMLASVTERTREIGVRRALGATRLHILAQFLVETTVLSVVGGILGILCGLGVSGGLALLAGRIDGIETPVPTLWSIALGFTFAAVIGVLAGIYPAIKASWQDPIVALRHD